MNFLAHIYLSGNHHEIKIGNFIADSVRGRKYLNYPENIQKGILLHRAIDTYTDSHPTVRMSTKKLHKNYHHYSSVIVDILYDHFLAKYWSAYHNTPLDIYVEDFYKELESYYPILPEKVKKMMPYMIADNWLLSYKTVDGIGRILYQMNKRTKYKSKMNFAVIELEQYYTEFETEFRSFFDELITFSAHKLKSL